MPGSTIIVLGMHRSGTSALAGLLSSAGAEFGDRLIAADASVNPKGFWEHEEIVALHDRALAALGMSWDDPRRMPEGWTDAPELRPLRTELLRIVRRDFSEVPLWGLKDPRLCRLLPLWAPLFEELAVKPRVAMILRHPLEVAASLHRRNRFHTGHALLLWLRHVGEAAQHSAAFPATVLTYEALLQDWRLALAHIGRDLALPLSAGPKGRGDAEFVEPALRHHAAEAEADVAHPLLPMAQVLYQSAGTVDQLRKAWDSAAENLEAIAPVIAQWSDEVEALSADLERLSSREGYLTAEVRRVKSTMSWRLTGPLRGVYNLLKRPRGGC
jgi:hypothetical protein